MTGLNGVGVLTIVCVRAEGAGFLPARQEVQSRPDQLVDAEPGAGLLWREDHERAGIPAVVERSARVQQEEEGICLIGLAAMC